MLFADNNTAINWPMVGMAFVAGLPALIAAITTAWVTISKAKQLEGKINENTTITQASVSETTKKVDSALGKAAEDAAKMADQSKVEAKQAAIQVAAVALTEAKKSTEATKAVVEEIKVAVNGRMDELLESAKKAAFQDGYAKGLQDGRSGT